MQWKKKSYQNTPVLFLFRSNAQRTSSAALSDCYRKDTWQQFFNPHLKTCYQKAANGSLSTDQRKVKSEIKAKEALRIFFLTNVPFTLHAYRLL